MIDTGSHGAAIESLQRSINKRLRARSATSRVIKVDGQFGSRTRHAMAYAAYLLGADKATVDGMLHGTINAAEVEFVRNPGRRNQTQINLGKKRVAAHRAAVKKAQAAANTASAKVKKLITEAERAAANYRKQPGAYHYLAGGVANLIYLEPSPRTYRSDCSQFVASLYKAADLPSPASVPHIWASTWTMVKAPGVRFVDKAHRKPGMLGMYGSRTAPHHVELFCGNKFIGHGSPPIDSLTPGEPDYYLDFPFLN
jgi:cell wall-associated NlpC family hydrolase